MLKRSRAHLYRSGGAPRPFATVLAFAVWFGAALLVLVVRGPVVLAGASPAAGPDSALLEAVFSGGILAGVVILVAELVAGRSRARALRLGLAALVLAFCAAGEFAAAGPANALRRGWIPSADAATPPPAAEVAEVTSLHRRAVRWLALAAAAAGAGVVVTLGAIRRGERRA